MNDQREAIWWRALIGGALLAALPALFLIEGRSSPGLLKFVVALFAVGTVGWAVALRWHREPRVGDGMLIGVVAVLTALSPFRDEWFSMRALPFLLCLVYVGGGLGAVTVAAAAARRAFKQAPRESSDDAPRTAVWWRALVGGALLTGPGLIAWALFRSRPLELLVWPAALFCLGTIGWFIALRRHPVARVTDGVVVGLISSSLAYPVVAYAIPQLDSRSHYGSSFMMMVMFALITGWAAIPAGVWAGFITARLGQRRHAWCAARQAA